MAHLPLPVIDERRLNVEHRRLDLVVRTARSEERAHVQGPSEVLVFGYELSRLLVLSDRMKEVDAEVGDQPTRGLEIVGGDDRVIAAAPKIGVRPRRLDKIVGGPATDEEADPQRPIRDVERPCREARVAGRSLVAPTRARPPARVLTRADPAG
jgi:hypothetical protein